MESATQPMDMHPMLTVTKLTMNTVILLADGKYQRSIEYLSLGNLVCEAETQNHTIVNKIKT